jgi:hypothetical protein
MRSAAPIKKPIKKKAPMTLGRAARPMHQAWYHRPYYGRPYSHRRYYNYYGAHPMAPGAAVGTFGWCEQHFRTFNPATGMYRGFDGRHHHCP